MRGHGGVYLREVVKRSLEVPRGALLSEGIGNVECRGGEQHIGWDVSNKNIYLSSHSLWLCTLGVAFDVIFLLCIILVNFWFGFTIACVAQP